MSAELIALLSELQRFELPPLTPDSFKIGGALLSALPVNTRPENVYQALDYYLTQWFPYRFDPPLVFQWAGGPDDGRMLRRRPDEEDFESLDAFEQAQQEYWEHFREPEPWQELTCPLRAAGDNRGPRAQRPPSLRSFLMEHVSWTINNKLYRLERPEGTAYVAYSMDTSEKETIKAQEAEHQQQRAMLIDRFLAGLSPPCRFFHTNHVLDPRSAEERGWSMHFDEVFALLDPLHLRLLWTLRDREYG